MSVSAPYTTIVELARALRAGAVTPTALAEQYLERIEQLDGSLRILSSKSGTVIEATVPLSHLLPPQDKNETEIKASA